MAKVVWSPRSIKDIEEIAEYIGKYSVQYARAQTQYFIDEAQALESHPYKGRIVPELKMANIRQVLCGHYRIIYEILNSKKEVGIITIHHQSRLLKNNPGIKNLRRKK